MLSEMEDELIAQIVAFAQHPIPGSNQETEIHRGLVSVTDSLNVVNSLPWKGRFFEAVKQHQHPGFKISQYIRLVFDVVKGPLRTGTTVPWAPVKALEYLSRKQQDVPLTASGSAPVQSIVEPMASSSHEATPPRTVTKEPAWSARKRHRQNPDRGTRREGGSRQSTPRQTQNYGESDEEEGVQPPKKVRIMEGPSVRPRYDADERPIKSEPGSPVCSGLLTAGRQPTPYREICQH